MKRKLRNMKRVLGTIICLATGCTTTAFLGTESGARTATAKAIYYMDAERTLYERFVQDETNALWWEGGNVASTRRFTQGKKDAPFEDFTSAPLHDCSDEKFRCVYGLHRVFAVPRAGLGLQSTYRAGGAVFHVEKCLRGSETQCSEALISSDCQSKAEPDRCVEAVGGRANSPSPGPIVYFLFKTKTGVTAYGDGTPVVGEEAQLAAAKELRLRGSKGLLGDEGLPPGR